MLFSPIIYFFSTQYKILENVPIPAEPMENSHGVVVNVPHNN